MRYTILFLLSFLLHNCQEAPESMAEATSSIQLQEKKTFQAGQVFADNEFDGARLNGFEQVNDSTYKAIISPENIPVNNSPWFAFRLWSEVKQNIVLELTYTHHGHRFVPKTSMDGIDWKPLHTDYYELDTVAKKAMVLLPIGPEKLWLAAQEVMSSQRTNAWADSLAQLSYIQKKEVGKSVQGKPISVLEIKEGEGKQTIVLIGRQHPPEVPGGTIALKAFVQTLLADTELAKRFRAEFEIILFPLLNPDGADLGHWRHNANGVDLNRDWQAFSQPETQLAKNYLENHKANYRYGIDFHTSYSGPYLLVMDTVKQVMNPVLTNEWISSIRQAQPAQKLDIRPRAQDLPYCYNYFINRLNMEAVTYEDGDEKPRREIRNRAKLYAEQLMRVLLRG